ncbi:MAG: hypothetical protein HWE21_18735 [Cytophagia bacterium]|nr:hypothetical protein [Cytophagia bacterium]
MLKKPISDNNCKASASFRRRIILMYIKDEATEESPNSDGKLLRILRSNISDYHRNVLPLNDGCREICHSIALNSEWL